jgi:ribosome-binding factor A
MGQTHRRERVQSEMATILNTVFRFETKDPRLQSVYVMEVRVSSDLRVARVYWRTEDGTPDEDVLAALERGKGFLRKQVAEKLNIRFAPELAFFRDSTLERGERVLGLIREVTAADAAAHLSDESGADEPSDE